jgi:hypothetical protein
MLLNKLSTTIRLQLGSATRAVAVISIAATLAGNVNADCVPTVLDRYQIPFTMTAHRNDGLVSYTTGQLSPSASWFGQLLSGGGTALFSDRTYITGTGWFATPAPFDPAQPDAIQLSIVKTLISPGVIRVTVTDGGWTGSFVGQCDPVTNLLYGSLDSSTMAVISFGTPWIIR